MQSKCLIKNIYNSPMAKPPKKKWAWKDSWMSTNYTQGWKSKNYKGVFYQRRLFYSPAWTLKFRRAFCRAVACLVLSLWIIKWCLMVWRRPPRSWFGARWPGRSKGSDGLRLCGANEDCQVMKDAQQLKSARWGSNGHFELLFTVHSFLF